MRIWLTLFLITTALVAAGALVLPDRLALDAAQLAANAWLDLFSSVVGLFGQAEVTAGLAAGLAVARFRRSPRDAIVPLLVVVTVLVEAILKTVITQPPLPPERSRTVELLPALHVPFAFSYPSGHVARTTFLLAIARGLPRWAVVAGVALMIATRVYLGEHWLSDTIGGVLLGAGVASAARRLS